MGSKAAANEQKDVMKTLKAKSRGKRKRVIIITVVLVIVIAVVFINNQMRRVASEVQEALSVIQTDEVTRRSLINSVGATGTIVSVKSKDLSTTLTGIDVAEVLVSVGDSVTAGQELVRFDTSDIEENLQSAKETLTAAQKRNGISAADANRNVSDAERASEFQIDSAQSSVDSALKDYNDAVDDYNEAVTTLEDLKRREREADSTYCDTKEALSNADKALATSRQAYETGAITLEEYNGAQQSHAEVISTNTAAEAAYNAAKANREAQESTVESLNSQVEMKLETYNSTVKSYENTVASQASTVASAKSSQSTVGLNSSTDSEEKQVEQYEEQLADSVLTAPFEGIVTAVNVEKGDTYSQGTIVTVQDCSSYEIEAEIGEYDISDIMVGQQVLIKTDATGDEELEGTVTFVSPVATLNAGSSGEVTYQVKISIDTLNERLRLDMSASLSIIIEQHEQALTVPYNAVQEDEEGNHFVEVVGEDNVTTTKVPVHVVMESNYYTEIEEGNVSEGMKVRVIDESTTGMGFDFMTMDGGGF